MFNTFNNKELNDEDKKEISERTIKIRYDVEQEMRKELKS
jgi:hypothetical protein